MEKIKFSKTVHAEKRALRSLGAGLRREAFESYVNGKFGKSKRQVAPKPKRKAA